MVGGCDMIDMHSHILFGVDDGACTIDDSMELINEEIAKGVDQIILTPHFNKFIKHDSNKIYSNYNSLINLAEKENLNVRLYLGNEIFMDSNFYEVLESGGFYTLASSDYVLIEFSFIDLHDKIAEMCYETRLKGYIPVLAHVERYSFLYYNTKLLKEILNEGALLQINASTVINMESKESCKFANYLLKHELISFVASDVHNIDSRGFYLDEAFKVVKKTCSEAYAEKIFKLNQQKIISNEYFDTPVIKSSEGKILSKLFRNK